MQLRRLRVRENGRCWRSPGHDGLRAHPHRSRMAAGESEEDAIVDGDGASEDGRGDSAGDGHSSGATAQRWAGGFCFAGSCVARLERDARRCWRAGRCADAGVANENLAEAAVGSRA